MDLKIILVILTAVICCSCSNCYEYTIRLDFTGLIVDKKEDLNNHAYPSFEIKQDSVKKSFGGVSFYDLYDLVDIGDSLIKKSGSLDFKIVKKDTIIYYLPNCSK